MHYTYIHVHVCTYMYMCIITCMYVYLGSRYPSTQFHEKLEQFRVTELLVTTAQQYSSVLDVQVSQDC